MHDSVKLKSKTRKAQSIIDVEYTWLVAAEINASKAQSIIDVECTRLGAVEIKCHEGTVYR